MNDQNEIDRVDVAEQKVPKWQSSFPVGLVQSQAKILVPALFTKVTSYNHKGNNRCQNREAEKAKNS
jgi:hypothetical protein